TRCWPYLWASTRGYRSASRPSSRCGARPASARSALPSNAPPITRRRSHHTRNAEPRPGRRLRTRLAAPLQSLHTSAKTDTRKDDPMAKWLKRGKDVEARAEADRQVRSTVESILGDIERRGDEAVRELSRKFDNWDREDFRLSQAEIDACMAQLSDQDLSD